MKPNQQHEQPARNWVFEMRIVRDSRERTPFPFDDDKYKGVILSEGSLTTGDYSIVGLENQVAVERKSLPDFVASISTGRERFEREAGQGKRLECFHGGGRSPVQ